MRVSNARHRDRSAAKPRDLFSRWWRITTDLGRRLVEHRSGRVAHTARYRIDRLIYIESSDTAPDAIAREKQLKGWRRAKKIGLINRANPDWRDLSGEIHTGGWQPKKRSLGFAALRSG